MDAPIKVEGGCIPEDLEDSDPVDDKFDDGSEGYKHRRRGQWNGRTEFVRKPLPAFSKSGII
jgi:hypothetical protein